MKLAMDLAENDHVIILGKIQNDIGDLNAIFDMTTGYIGVEIDNGVWWGKEFNNVLKIKTDGGTYEFQITEHRSEQATDGEGDQENCA